MYFLSVGIYTFVFIVVIKFEESPRGVGANVLDSKIVATEFELQSCYYVHFRTNTIGKAMGKIVPLLPFWNKVTEDCVGGAKNKRTVSPIER